MDDSDRLIFNESLREEGNSAENQHIDRQGRKNEPIYLFFKENDPFGMKKRKTS